MIVFRYLCKTKKIIFMQTAPTYRQSGGDEPLISFIIADYNVPAELLRECLDSIFALSLSDGERGVIVVDDGSTESPLGDITNYLDKITYVRQRNQGLSAARNTGLRLAHGRFIQFVDADDKLFRPAYEYCLDIIRFKDSDIVLFDMTTKDNGGSLPDSADGSEGPMTGSHFMKHHNLRAAACGYIFRSSMRGNLSFHYGIMHEDEEFTPLLFLRAEKVYATKAVAYYYRQHHGSITHNNDKRSTVKRLNDTFGVLLTLQARIDTLPFNERSALQRRIDQLSADYIYNVITLTHDSRYLERCVARMQEHGLFPLPTTRYTRKYLYFSRMVNSKHGRKLLMAILFARRR